jgi:hypothetical protein
MSRSSLAILCCVAPIAFPQISHAKLIRYNDCERAGLSAMISTLKLDPSSVSLLELAIDEGANGSITVEIEDHHLATVMDPDGIMNCDIPYSQFDGNACTINSNLKADACWAPPIAGRKN